VAARQLAEGTGGDFWTHISSLAPSAPTLENYVHGWAGFGGVTFATFYKNSFLYAGLGTILTIGSSAVVAFGFARIRFAGRRFWFAAMLSTLLLPVQVQIIPQYIVFTKLGWLNTFSRSSCRGSAAKRFSFS
jgi:multiple sugar transport system permease protein